MVTSSTSLLCLQSPHASKHHQTPWTLGQQGPLIFCLFNPALQFISLLYHSFVSQTSSTLTSHKRPEHLHTCLDASLCLPWIVLPPCSCILCPEYFPSNYKIFLFTLAKNKLPFPLTIQFLLKVLPLQINWKSGPSLPTTLVLEEYTLPSGQWNYFLKLGCLPSSWPTSGFCSALCSSLSPSHMRGCIGGKGWVVQLKASVPCLHRVQCAYFRDVSQTSLPALQSTENWLLQ